MKGLILTGGKFERMNPLASFYPKTMLQVQGKPILGHVIDALISTGIHHIVVVIGQSDLFSSVIRYLRSGKFGDSIKIDIITQKEPGVRGAILSAWNEFKNEGKVFLAHGDIIATKSFYQHLNNTVHRTGADGGVAMTLKSSIEDFGVCTLDSTGNIAKVIEHPGQGSDVGNYIGAGAYIFPNKFFEILSESSDFDKAINNLVETGYRLAGSIFSDENKWMDIGTPYDLLSANHILFSEYDGTIIHSTAKISPSAQLIGPVKVESGAVIEHGAIIKGPVYIGKNVYIGTNSLIRGYTSIEENCTIGFSVELKNTHLQPKTRIGRLSFLGDSIVGMNVNVNSGVTIMNHITENQPEFIVRGTNFNHKIGSVLGDYCTIGANDVLEPQTKIGYKEIIPPGVVITTPH